MFGKIKTLSELKAIFNQARLSGNTTVFTNGCFDILHVGHVHLLEQAKGLGNILLVALNSDKSVKALKHSGRPVIPETERARMIAALEMVDYVTLFDETDPYRLISELKPDVLVKGGDWTTEKVVGKDVVEGSGGRVVLISYLKGHSTTEIIERISKG